MGKLQRNKGQRGEREVVNMLKDRGYSSKRISMMETNSEDKGDIETPWGKAQVKLGGNVPKFVHKSINDDEELMFCRRDYKDWMVVVPFDKFIKLLEE